MFKIYMYQNIIFVFVRFKWVVCIFYESGHLILIRNVFSLFFFLVVEREREKTEPCVCNTCHSTALDLILIAMKLL